MNTAKIYNDTIRPPEVEEPDLNIEYARQSRNEWVDQHQTQALLRFLTDERARCFEVAANLANAMQKPEDYLGVVRNLKETLVLNKVIHYVRTGQKPD